MGNLMKSDAFGYSITSSMNEIIANNMYNSSPIRRFARIVNVSRDNLDVASYTQEIVATWGDDKTVAPETDAFSKKNIPVCDLTAQPKITQRMIDDAEIDHEAWIAELLSDIFSSQEDKAFLHGTGDNQPKGILSYPAGVGSNQIERVAEPGKTGKVSFEGLLKLQASLDGKYEKNGQTMFLTSKSVLAQIRAIKDDNGAYIWTPGLLVGQQDTLFGTPIFAESEMENTNGDAVIYANLRKGYQIVDRADIKIQRDPYSSKPFVVYFATKRVGGDVIDTNAIKVLKIS
jgi:HK97 family phage major capsid protein